MALQSITLQLDVRSWPLKIPFRITGHVFDSLDLLVCTLSCDGVTGQGEAAGV